jgi:curli biogenesis system outer membrane secretion channel CsgG
MAVHIYFLRRTLFMKKFILILVAFIGLFCTTALYAADKPSIAVMRFTNNTRAPWWSNSTAAELQDMLINELASTKAFRIMERKELKSAISEQQLSESGMVESSSKVKLGKLKGAQFLISATISAFEESTEGSGGGLHYRGYSFGGDKKKAYIAVDLKVIDAETGEIIDTRTVEASSTSGGMKVSGPSGMVPGLSGGLSKQEKTPVGKVIRGCIVEITDYLECSMTSTQNDECRQKYSGKDTRRRDRTKSSILLDE